MRQIHHKIRGSHPGFIGIELPEQTSVLLLDEENFNAYRRNIDFNGIEVKVKDGYCHFEKPINGSWHVVIEGRTCDFSPKQVHIIYKAA